MIPYALRFAPLLVLPGNVLGIEQKAVLLLLLRARTLNCYVTIDECITNIPEVYTYLYMYLPAVPDWLMIRFHACTYYLLVASEEPFLSFQIKPLSKPEYISIELHKVR